MYEDKVDPIRYAWTRCNSKASFPNLLARTAGSVPSEAGQSITGRAPVVVQVDAKGSTVRAALHSLIVGRRPHRIPKP
jgi:hypothetical protein